MKIAVAAVLLASCASASHELKVGDAAPAFTLPDTSGRAVSLESVLARGPAILAFFPKAFTGG